MEREPGRGGKINSAKLRGVCGGGAVPVHTHRHTHGHGGERARERNGLICFEFCRVFIFPVSEMKAEEGV